MRKVEGISCEFDSEDVDTGIEIDIVVA